MQKVTLPTTSRFDGMEEECIILGLCLHRPIPYRSFGAILAVVVPCKLLVAGAHENYGSGRGLVEEHILPLYQLRDPASANCLVSEWDEFERRRRRTRPFIYRFTRKC